MCLGDLREASAHTAYNFLGDKMTATDAPLSAAPVAKTWFGHPRQLALLFTTEAWERFGYYGMRALLTLYLIQHFAFADRVANGLYGAFTSLVYLTPLVGGLVADRFLGSKRAVKFGALLMSVGYLMLAFSGGELAKPYATIGGQRYDVIVERNGEDSTQYIVADGQRHKIVGNKDGSISLEGASGSLPAKVAAGGYKFDAERNTTSVMLLFLSLALVIAGNGYFKPNISTIVGSLYGEGDRKRDTGFTIFYMGINLGSIFSQWLAPLIAALYGFKWGFALAGFGMLIAWARFQFSGSVLQGYGDPPKNNLARDFIVIVLSFLAVPGIWFLLNNAMVAATAAHAAAASGGVMAYLGSLPLLGQIMFAVFILSLVGFPLWAAVTLKAVDRDRMIVAIALMFFSVVFWTLFEQAGSSLTLFAERNTDRLVNIPFYGQYLMPAGQAQVFNPVFIVLFAPLFSIMWNVLARLKIEPPVPIKFSIGLLLVGVGFLALVFGGQFHDGDFRVPLFWLALAYFIHSMGELCLSPVGLSAITKLSVPRLVGMMMGVWFLSSAMAQYIGGIVAQFASTETVGGQVLNPQVSFETYLGVFKTIGIAGVIAGIVLFVLSPLLRRGMHGVH
jgi:POT family proton-dependent oligopeptide transporter